MPDKKPMDLMTITEKESGLVDPYAQAIRDSLDRGLRADDYAPAPEPMRKLDDGDYILVPDPTAGADIW
jgi:hypothetical protein